MARSLRAPLWSTIVALLWRSTVPLYAPQPQRATALPTYYAASHPPITLIGGFLGAGKTSTVTSMLLNRRDLRIAVLVNDLASVNVDAADIRRTMQGEDGVATVELDNGCICCGTGAKGLGPTIRGLRDGFDHIVVELSGVADPLNVRSSLRSEGLTTSRTVTLIDSDAFPSNWATLDLIAERREIVEEAFESRAALSVTDPVVELMLRGVEAADVLVLNKCDLASPDAARETESLCRALNTQAEFISTQFGVVAELDRLLPPLAQVDGDGPPAAVGRREPRNAVADATTTDATTTNAMGITSFVYSARRPLVESRLAALIAAWPLAMKCFLGDEADGAGDGATGNEEEEEEGPFAGLLRSKGVAWLGTHHEQVASWSHAGRHFSLEPEQCWWAVLPDADMRDILAAEESGAGPGYEGATSYDAVRSCFDGVDGDRRQEIVFIGVELLEAEIRAALDACLATDEEMREYRTRWDSFQPSRSTWLSYEDLRRVAL